jgi:hypothetical protein
VYEIRVLKRIFGPNRDEIIGGSRKLNNEELRNMYSSPNTIRIIKSRRIRWARNAALTEEKMNACRVLVGKLAG